MVSAVSGMESADTLNLKFEPVRFQLPLKVVLYLTYSSMLLVNLPLWYMLLVNLVFARLSRHAYIIHIVHKMDYSGNH